MDVVNHALAGAATGMAFGRPLLGAFFGVLPDIVIGVKRREFPHKLYDFTHSLSGVYFMTIAGFAITGSIAVPLLALLSHLALDIPTHGEDWAPPLLFPFDPYRFSPLGEEWEWFNPIWFFGLLLTIFWSSLWLGVASVTGYL